MPGGDVLKGMTSDECGTTGFGEVYFSFVEDGHIKGWKRHNRMTSNLFVPVGKVRFMFIGDNHEDRLEVLSGPGSPKRIYVPPGYWMAFSGAGPGPNLVVNVADIPHDDGEEERQDLTAFKF